MGDDDKLDRTAARLMDDWRETNESWTQLIERIDAALRRAKAEVWREAATHVLTCMHAVDAANDFDARAARIEEGE